MGGGGSVQAPCFRTHASPPRAVSDWDHFERLFVHGFSSVLSTVPDKHPLIVTEPSFNDRTKRAKYGELMFETLNAPAAFLAKDAVLAWCVLIAVLRPARGSPHWRPRPVQLREREALGPGGGHGRQGAALHAGARGLCNDQG